jgi:hypothetical protein
MPISGLYMPLDYFQALYDRMHHYRSWDYLGGMYGNGKSHYRFSHYRSDR